MKTTDQARKLLQDSEEYHESLVDQAREISKFRDIISFVVDCIDFAERRLPPEETEEWSRSNKVIPVLSERTKHSPGVVQAAKRIYQGNVLDILIPETIEFPRSFDKRTPLVHILPKHQGSLAYQNLAQWIIEHA